MHTEISYKNLEGDAKREKAIQDTKEWLGEDRFAKAVDYVKSCSDLQQVEFAFGMFLGIEGYPVQAMWETYHK